MIYYISMLSTTGGKLKFPKKDTWGIFKNKTKTNPNVVIDQNNRKTIKF